MVFCRIDDIRLYYEDYGVKSQIPLIFLHGVMGTSEIWKPQVDHFKKQRRTIILDLRGHGQSDKPRKKYSITQFSDDLHSLMKTLDIEKAISIGHSLGGMTALRFAINYQDMVDKLILHIWKETVAFIIKNSDGCFIPLIFENIHFSIL
jgi:3-oxoadipate enol-lactonase